MDNSVFRALLGAAVVIAIVAWAIRRDQRLKQKQGRPPPPIVPRRASKAAPNLPRVRAVVEGDVVPDPAGRPPRNMSTKDLRVWFRNAYGMITEERRAAIYAKYLQDFGSERAALEYAHEDYEHGRVRYR